jgi:hypothetical protein
VDEKLWFKFLNLKNLIFFLKKYTKNITRTLIKPVSKPKKNLKYLKKQTSIE